MQKVAEMRSLEIFGENEDYIMIYKGSEVIFEGNYDEVLNLQDALESAIEHLESIEI